jgi:pyruvate kinase
MLESRGDIRQRQVVGIVAGTRTLSGATNFMRLHTVGDRDNRPRQNQEDQKEKVATRKPQPPTQPIAAATTKCGGNRPAAIA